MLSLAYVYAHQGRHAESRHLKESILPVARRTLGPEHPITLKTSVNLACSYSDDKMSEEVQNLLEDVLPICRRCLGPDDFFTLAAANVLGIAYDRQNHHAEAQVLYEDVVCRWKRVLGAGNPTTLQAMLNLQISFYRQGNQVKAQALLGEIIEEIENAGDIWENEALNYKWIFMLNSLTLRLVIQGRPVEAERRIRDILPTLMDILGGQHPKVAEFYKTLGRALWQQGRREEALSAWQEAAQLNNIPAMNYLAWHKSLHHDPSFRNGLAAIELAEKAVAATERTKPVYLDTLACAHAETGAFDEAVKIQKEAIALLKQVKPGYEKRLKLFEAGVPYREHGKLADFASELLVDSRFTEAEQPARECLAIREILMPDDNQQINEARDLLKISLLGQKKSNEDMSEQLIHELSSMRISIILTRGSDAAKQQERMEAARLFADALQEPAFDWSVAERQNEFLSMQMAVCFRNVGDRASSDHLCNLLLAIPVDDMSPQFAERHAKSCFINWQALTPECRRDALDLARCAMERVPPESGLLLWLRYTNAMGEFYMGNWELAIDMCNKAEDSSDLYCKGGAVVYRAMALKQLGRNAEAGKALRQAEELLSDPMKLRSGGSWWDLEICQLAMGDAHRMINSSSEQ
jgi:tetratricopeptide (TPR) repeat protein